MCSHYRKIVSSVVTKRDSDYLPVLICGTCHMASTFMPHPRTATTTICSTNSLLLLKFTLSRLMHFYCCKRLLGRNNTATTSAPHERCQHLLKGALLLSMRDGLAALLALLLSTFADPFLSTDSPLPRHIITTSQQSIPKLFFLCNRPVRNSVQEIHPANQQKAEETHATSCSSSDLRSWCSSHNLRLVTKSLV